MGLGGVGGVENNPLDVQETLTLTKSAITKPGLSKGFLIILLSNGMRMYVLKRNDVNPRHNKAVKEEIGKKNFGASKNGLFSIFLKSTHHVYEIVSPQAR